MAISFFKLPEHRVFEYKPRIYDARADRLQQRRRELGLLNDGQGSDADTAQIGRLVRNGFLRAHRDEFQQRVRKQKAASRRRIVLIILAFVLLIYIVMNGFGERIIEAMLYSK